jgi:hypothetical protein
MPKEIRFRDVNGNSINTFINHQNKVFITINDDKSDDDLWEYVVLDKEDVFELIDYLQELYEKL